jgi:hypothetical protein
MVLEHIPKEEIDKIGRGGIYEIRVDNYCDKRVFGL